MAPEAPPVKRNHKTSFKKSTNPNRRDTHWADIDDPEQLKNPLVRQNRSARAHLTRYVALRATGLKNIEIAPMLGMNVTSLNSLITKASKAGWLKLDNPEEILEHAIKPIVLENIETFLKSDNDAHRLKMTVEAAKGVGYFKAHQAVKVEGDQSQMVLALRFETPEAPQGQIIEGHIIGAPRLPPGVIE